MKTTRIFIASSSELAADRAAFRNFLSVENDRLHKKDQYLELVQWEYFLDTVAHTRLQDEYNSALQACDLVVCLFHTKAGKYTLEEFDTALRHFQETGKPLIYTYFKDGAPEPEAGDERGQDLQKFKQRLADIGHFYTVYKNIEDLQYKFRLQLDRLEERGIIVLREEVRQETEQLVANYFSLKNVNTGSIRAEKVQFGDSTETHYHYGDRKIPRALTANPFQPDIFLGRDADLQAVHQKLFSGENLLLLVNGEGGIGKTTFAAKYWERYGNDYQHLAWVFCGTSLLDALLTLAPKLQVSFPDTMPAPERLTEMLTVMADLEKPCLLVLDNANDVRNLSNCYKALRSCFNFHILLTTRITAFDQAKIYPIPPLEEADALQLFKRHYPGHAATEDELLKAIRTAIGGNTLVLELLAKNLAAINTDEVFYSLADLLTDLQQKGLFRLSQEQTVRIAGKGNRPDLLETKPTEVLAALYDEVEMVKPLQEEEKALLSNLAVLPAENIPYELLKALLAPEDARTFSQNLTDLATRGWIEKSMGADRHTLYKISPVVQEITRYKNEAELAGHTLGLINILNEKLEYEGNGHLVNAGYDEAAFFARLAEVVCHNLSQPASNLSLLTDRIASFYTTTGDLVRSKQYYETALAIDEALSATKPDNPYYKNGLAISYSKLGETHAALGNLPQALKFYEDEIILFEQLYEAHPQNVQFKNGLAISYSKLGETHAALGNLPQALKFYEQRSQLGKELYEAYPQNVQFKNGLAISYSKLGETHAALGNLPQALKFYEDEIILFEQLYEAHPQNVQFKNGLAISYEKLGETHAALGNLPQALKFYEDELILFEQLYEAHPQNVQFKNGLAISYSKLGETHAALGNLPQALKFYEQRSQLGKELYEAYPQNVQFKNGLAISYSKLGRFYRDQEGDAAKARPYFEQCHQLWKELTEAYPAYVAFNNHFNWAKTALENLG